VRVNLIFVSLEELSEYFYCLNGNTCAVSGAHVALTERACSSAAFLFLGVDDDIERCSALNDTELKLAVRLCNPGIKSFAGHRFKLETEVISCHHLWLRNYSPGFSTSQHVVYSS
jgi:hypothetical protein